ncbi:MAG: SDR family oxidoreductase [Synechococcales cyanobacterium]
MQISGSVALVTGANRGIGQAYVEALLTSGARRIYATARTLSALDPVVALAPDRIVPLALDVTQPDHVHGVAQRAADVTLLINNAGVLGSGGLFAADSLDTAHWEMTTNYFGTLQMIRAFTPILKQQGGGAIVNMLSIASVANVPVFGTYSASKAALFSLTQAARAELQRHNILVVGVFAGPVDTPMAAGIPMDKVTPAHVASTVLAAVAQGQEDVYPDPISEQILSAVRDPLKGVERQFAGMVPA